MDAFLFLMLPKLEMLKQPTYELLDKTYEKLNETLKEACAFIFKRFPTIEMEIFDIINKDLAQVALVYRRRKNRPKTSC